MAVDAARAHAVFSEALEQPPAQRAGFLDRACAGDQALRERVERLLAAHESAGSFMAPPPPEPTIDLVIPIQEVPGAIIGRYKLLQQIGEGGFGVVFMAEQDFPVRRLVALKIIKLGMDTRQVVARFEAERQALAMMDHPAIAKVLDGGATETGRPYFVMELVKGERITEYCDKNRLTIPQRLDLMMQVCQAVQHAHQKGLIHRDLKPSNILVYKQDDRPVIKVIDFGIAKAMQARLTEKTMFTDFRQMIGTPEYMSPEQSEGDLDIDTRTDIYSLGVLLYELLTGSQQGLRRNAADHPRGRAARSQRTLEHSFRHAAVRRGPARRGTAQTPDARARRAGLDRDEGAGEGPQPSIRDDQRPGHGHPALPAR
jgi:eukaryotic-like serine/threonine-protein kinase